MELVCLDKRKFNYSGPMYYVGRSGKGVTVSLTISTRKRSNNNKKVRTSTNDVALQKIGEILESFKDIPHPVYMRNQSKNQPTKSYSFIVKHISKVLKIKKPCSTTYPNS